MPYNLRVTKNKPWLKHYDPHVPETLDFPDVPAYELLRQAALEFSEATAVKTLTGSVTYRELWEKANNVAASLQNHGLKKGDRVAVVLPNGIEAVETFWGVLLAGGSVVPVNPLYSEAEMRGILEQVKPKYAVILTELISKVPLVDSLSTIMAISGQTDWATQAANEFREPEIDPASDEVFVMFTGGTTGKPKGCVFTHSNYVAALYSQGVWVKGIETSQEERRILYTLPWFHIFGLFMMGYSTLIRGEMTVLAKFDAETVVRLISEQEFLYWPCVPAMLELVLRHPAVAGGEIVLRDRIRRISIGGDSAGKSLWQKIKDQGLTVLEGWGMTETCTKGTGFPSLGLKKPGSCGIPMLGVDVRIVYPGTETDVVLGEVGEMLVKGPMVMKGYLNNDIENRRCFTADGWFRTGDLARMDEDGFVYIAGRLKETIMHGGNTVYPQEIDSAILAFSEEILDSMTFGEPDEIYGENAVSVVRTAGGNLDTEALMEHLRSNLAPFKLPSRIVVTNEPLPRTPAGKPLRKVLAERYGRKGEKAAQ